MRIKFGMARPTLLSQFGERKQRIHLLIFPHQHNTLRRIAEQQRRSKSDVVGDLIDNYGVILGGGACRVLQIMGPSLIQSGSGDLDTTTSDEGALARKSSSSKKASPSGRTAKRRARSTNPG